MLHVPVVGGFGQSAPAAAASQWREQKFRVPPTKQTMLSQSAGPVQSAPNAREAEPSLAASGPESTGGAGAVSGEPLSRPPPPASFEGAGPGSGVDEQAAATTSEPHNETTMTARGSNRIFMIQGWHPFGRGGCYMLATRRSAMDCLFEGECRYYGRR